MDLPNKSDSAPATPPERKKLAPVIPGAVVVPRPATRRFLDYVFAESPKALGRKIGRDIIVPRIKAGFEEAANNFLSGMLWGAGNRPASNIVSGTVLRGGAQIYQQASQQPSALTQAREANHSRSSGNYEDLVCPTQEHAEFLLANLFKVLNDYRVATVADLYEMANMTPAPSAAAYGWMNLDSARISKVRNGFLLELPRPSLI